jgi:hypothetical protein
VLQLIRQGVKPRIVRRDRCTVLIPFATQPAQPMYCRFAPAVAVPAFSCPVSSSAPITRAPRRPPRLAASSRPATANRRTSLIAANVSQHALFSSRWVRSGVRSPTCSATVHPFRFGSPLTSAPTYLPACSHGSARTKHDLSASSSSIRFRPASRAPILAAAAAFDFVVFTNRMIARRLRHAKPGLPWSRAPPSSGDKLAPWATR